MVEPGRHRRAHLEVVHHQTAARPQYAVGLATGDRAIVLRYVMGAVGHDDRVERGVPEHEVLGGLANRRQTVVQCLHDHVLGEVGGQHLVPPVRLRFHRPQPTRYRAVTTEDVKDADPRIQLLDAGHVCRDAQKLADPDSPDQRVHLCDSVHVTPAALGFSFEVPRRCAGRGEARCKPGPVEPQQTRILGEP
jgi:hypothetical protein